MIPLLRTLPDIAGQTLTVDALLTQRALARYLLKRGAHYLFTAKGNQKLLRLNRGHWCIENCSHHCLDWTWDEDRSRIRTGHGPENTTRLRRFAITLIKARGLEVAPTVRRLARNVRAVLDVLKMTRNTHPRSAQRPVAR